MAKKKTTEKALNIDNILFNCRDYLRAARNSGSFFEKRDMMLTLVFLRFIGEKYEDGIENLKQTLKEQGLDPEDENIRAAFFDDATFADGTYNLPPEARWSTIISTPAPQLNVALDTALQRLEEEDPQLKRKYANVYNAMLENQKSYERGLDDLKLVCDAYIEDLRRQMPCEAIANYIEEVNKKNIGNLKLDSVRGIATSKEFINTKANMEGVSLENYKVVEPGMIAFISDTSRRADKMSLALNQSCENYLPYIFI